MPIMSMMTASLLLSDDSLMFDSCDVLRVFHYCHYNYISESVSQCSMQLDSDIILSFLKLARWLLSVLFIKVLYTPRLTHEYSYRNMQLSVQAADRQRKNILQMALRFHQRAQQMQAET